MDDPHQKRLEQLEERINRAKAPQASRPHVKEHYSQAHMAWRMVIELVAGIGFGFGVGYGLDVLFGTMPLMLVLFVLLGFAAGVRVMLGTAAELGRAQGQGDGTTTLPDDPATKNDAALRARDTDERD